MKKNISLIIQRKNKIKYAPIVKNFINDHYLNNKINPHLSYLKDNKSLQNSQYSFFTILNQFARFLISKIKLIILFLLVFISMIKLT